MAVTCLTYLGYYEFCEKVERVQYHPELTRLFVAHIQDNKVTLARVTFTVSPSIILDATRILNIGEKWYKAQDLDEHYYEPYIKPRYRDEVKRLFPFRFLEDKYVPIMKIIMKYFTCEGIFSMLKTYHIRLLMHFTKAGMLNLPYFLFRNIEKMAHFVQKKPYPQQMSSLYHYSLIKMIVLHHLSLLNISWETFIYHDIFRGPQIPPPVSQEAGGPSSSIQVKIDEEAKETSTEVPVTYMTYQRDTRILFAADRKVFAPWDVEGALPSSSTHRQMLAPQDVEGALPSY